MSQTFKIAVSALGLLLAACSQPVPNSAPSGVGFGDYGRYQAQRAARESQLSGRPLPLGPRISTETTGAAPVQTPQTPQTPPQTTPAAAPTAVASGALPTGTAGSGNAAISDEQNFQAVSSRETIESDAERLAAVRAERQEVAPRALPSRPANTGPNIVEFALSTRNSVGQQVYPRRRTSQARFDRKCAEFASPDLAQAAFLADGGPEKDRRGMDPDGDGFACAWSPQPFRNARQPVIRTAGRQGEAADGGEAAAIAQDALGAVLGQ